MKNPWHLLLILLPGLRFGLKTWDSGTEEEKPSEPPATMSRSEFVARLTWFEMNRYPFRW